MKFTPEALAGIFLGKITKWNDAALTGPNPGVNLPDDDIVVVHRSDGSGTTYVWTDYLSKVSEEWKSQSGKNTSVNWPVGLGGKGNEGVAGLVKQTPNSIGYVELIYADPEQDALWARAEFLGGFRQGDLATVTAAAAGVAARGNAGGLPGLHYRTRRARTAYPICQLHLAADSRSDRGWRQKRKVHHGLPALDVDRWAERWPSL